MRPCPRDVHILRMAVCIRSPDLLLTWSDPSGTSHTFTGQVVEDQNDCRNNGPDVWIYRWREPRKGGGTVQQKKIIGTKKQYATEASAWRTVDGLRLDINTEAVITSSRSMKSSHTISRLSLRTRTARRCEPKMSIVTSFIMSSLHSGRTSPI